MFILKCTSKNLDHYMTIDKISERFTKLLGYKYLVLCSSNIKDYTLKASSKYEAYRTFIRLRNDIKKNLGVEFEKHTFI